MRNPRWPCRRSRPARPLPVLLVASVALVLLAGCGDDDGGDAGAVDGVVVEDGQGNAHVADPTYDQAPPSGGDHLGVWLNCGIYDQPVPDGHAVHSLEHGVVWLAYAPDLPADHVEQLVELYERHPDRMIVSPYPGIEADVVAVAWERRLAANGVDDPRLAAFVDAFVNGEQSPEPGAPCRGGVG